MTAFIRQEALEKANEIRIKADEEFAIEKSKLVRQETAAIDSSYEKKFKQAAMSQQITRSTVANKTRLRVLGARQEVLDDLFDQTRSKIDGATKDKSKYQNTLKNLILEGLYALSESKAYVRARKADYDLVKKAADAAQTEYKKNTGKDVEIEIDESNPQPAEWQVYITVSISTLLTNTSAGGVSVVGGRGKIEVNNTFDERLKLLEIDALPAIRLMLFGANQNRKFQD
jgi:V-type H+-transporting ATPase subunit E